MPWRVKKRKEGKSRTGGREIVFTTDLHFQADESLLPSSNDP